MSFQSDRASSVIILVVAAFYAAQCAYFWPYTMDDAFITFRYSDHIAAGHGPIWNLADADAPVEGFTSMAHVFALAWLKQLSGVPVFYLSKGIGAAGPALAIFILAAWAQRRAFSPLQTGVLLSPFAMPFMAVNAVSGMETGPFVFLVVMFALATIQVFERRNATSVRVLVLVGLIATLTRPEFGAPFLVTSVALWVMLKECRRDLLVAVLAGYVLPGVLLTIWRLSYYGLPLPQPFFVKQGGVSKFGGLVQFQYVLKFALFLALPYLALAFAGWRSLSSSRRHVLVAGLLISGTTLAYYLSVVPLMGWWYRYLVPQLPVIALVAAAGGMGLAGNRFRAPLAAFAGLWLLLISLLHLPAMAQWLNSHYLHELRYREVGDRLAPYAAADRWMVFWDVGAIVYDSDWNTIDVVGLNTRRKDIQDNCVMSKDLVLFRHGVSEPPNNPCPDDVGRYEIVAVLPFMETERGEEISMTIFGRSDLDYLDGLKRDLTADWIGPFTQEPRFLPSFRARTAWLFSRQ